MKHNTIIGLILRMAMTVPIRGMYMNLHVTRPLKTINYYPGIKEVWTCIFIQITCTHYFKCPTIGCGQISAYQLMLPNVLQERLGHSLVEHFLHSVKEASLLLSWVRLEIVVFVQLLQ